MPTGRKRPQADIGILGYSLFSTGKGLNSNMKLFAQIALIAGIHIAFLFVSYGTGFFGFDLPYNLTIVLWLGASPLVALVVYYRTLSNSHWLISSPYRVILLGACATIASLISLYIGALLAVNSFGT